MQTTAMSMCAIPSSPRRGRQTTSISLGWLTCVLTYILLSTSTQVEEVNSQYSSHCHFNQLCSCRVVPVKRNSNYGGPRPPPPPSSGGREISGYTTPTSISRTTTNSYSGQFGIIDISQTSTDSTNEDPTTTVEYDDYEPLFSLGLRSSRQVQFYKRLVKNDWEIRDIHCQGVPFTKLPDFPIPGVTHMEIVEAGLVVVENDAISPVTVESVRLMRNQISAIEVDAFRNVASSLRSLDLSDNKLPKLPLAALSRLKALDWINLHRNEIAELEDISFLHLKDTVSTIFLGENDLTKVPPSFFKSFRRLIWLNLDKNHLKEVEPGSLPPSLTTLSLSHNHFAKFPLEITDSLPDLTWYSLRGNYIETIPLEPFHVLRQLDRLDLGENFLTSLPPIMFNGTLTINDLNLEYNYIERLEDSAFISLQPRRLYLGHNRISYIDPKTFNGVELLVELVDLEANKLNEVSEAFGSLKRLRYLYLSNNNISQLPYEVFSPNLCSTLRAMKLASNGLQRYPTEVLHRCKTLSHLDLGYNRIQVISVTDTRQSCDNLDTLILRGNQIRELESRIFKDCAKLRELSLSYNAISRIDSEAFRYVGDTLESLEISFGLRMKAFPGKGLRPLTRLLWLAMDNNDLEQISETDLYSLGELQYLNLESNRLTYLPKNMLHKNVHKKLLDVRLSYNKLKILDSHTFSSLSTLQTVTMTGNPMVTVETSSFHNLPNLKTVLLTQNQLRSLAHRSFSHLTSLQRLELQHNFLSEFSLAAFENCSNQLNSPMMLNISFNRLDTLVPAPKAKIFVPPFIHVLDASRNLLTRIPLSFLEQIAPALRRLDLSYNRISDVANYDLKSLLNLQELKLMANNIIDLQKGALRHLTGLQSLDLSRNRIEVLQFGQFAGLSGLRIVNLSHNRLRSLPRDVFHATNVDSVNLSFNEFVAMPTSALTEVAASLRSLDLSFNAIEHLDSTMFANTPRLTSLSLAKNRLTILPDNIFIGLNSLRTLDLSSNPIRANYPELLTYVQRLNTLKLADVEMTNLPVIPLQHLIHLDLSGNRLTDVPFLSAEGILNLRHLNLSRNQFTHLPAHSWHRMPYLKTLDISWNPIRVLTRESFYGLSKLQVLRVQHLPDLKRFDGDSLAHITYLTKLYIQSWPSIEKYKFRLGSVVSGIASLRTLSAIIEEPNGILTDQILGAFGPKLRNLELTGTKLRQVTMDAFEGIDSYELLLAIRGTSLETLPMHFFKMFENVAHWSLDLSNNKLTTLETNAFYQNGTDWRLKGTSLLQGGLSLQGNPWLCSCQNTWLGTWLRRWMRETLQLHASIIDRNHHIQTMVRTIKCQVPALPVDRWYSSSAVSVSAHDMKMAATAASSGHSSYNKDGSGQHNNNNNNPVSTSVSARNLRPLVELSEAETSSWSCSALKRGRNSASAIKNVSEVIVLSLLCVFCLLKNAVIS